MELQIKSQNEKYQVEEMPQDSGDNVFNSLHPLFPRDTLDVLTRSP